jgi:hypothetical protein
VSEGVYTPYLFACRSALGSVFAMHIEDHRLFLLSFHYCGASKFWVIVKPSSSARLEACLASYLEDVLGLEWATPRCS